MKNEKLVKLSAIEAMAKPMSKFHKGEKPMAEKPEMEEEEIVECPKCGHAFKVVKAEPEYEEDSEDEYEED
jgi:hypothetical protein